MEARQRRNLLYGVMAVGVTLALLLRALDILPEGVSDMLYRAWPTLLVLLGLSLLLRDRGALGSLFALLVSAALAGGVAVTAYSSRASQPRDDQQKVIAQAVSSSITLVAVNVDVLATDVEILTTDADVIAGEFVGSTASAIDVQYHERDNGTAEFTLIESKSDQFPLLEAVGRGRLRLQLPGDLATALAFAGDNGDVTLNLSDLALERLSLVVDQGNVLVTLPDYQPLSPNAAERPGQLGTNDGDMTIFVPPTAAARLELNRGGNDIRPQFDDTYILIDDGADGTLEKRNILDSDTLLYYEVTVPRGVIRLEVSSPQ